MSSSEDFFWIKDGENILALYIPCNFSPGKTTFITPEDLTQQCGFILYKKGESIVPHDHKKIGRIINKTSEILLLKKGKVEAQIFNKEREYISTVILNPGDLLLLIDGGHGFKMIEDSIIVEIKQGPYLGIDDKERFHWNEK